MTAILNPFFLSQSPDALPFFSGDLATIPFYDYASWPAAIYHAASNKTFISWETETRPNSIKVAEYDHATSTFTQIVTVDSHLLEDDSHGMPVLEILSDGRMVCFYGSHGSAADLEWSISDQSGGNPDISNWTRQTALTAATYTYPKPVNVPGVGGAGTLYLFARDYNGSGYPLVVQSATYTSGGAVSFGAKSTIYDRGTARVYAGEFHLDGSGNIEIACTNSDSGDTVRRHVHFFRYMTATGAVENFDGSTSTASGSLPIDTTLADSDYRIKTSSLDTGFVSFCRDTNGYAHLLYGDGTSPSVDIKHTFHNGTSWSAETTLFQARDAGPLIGTTAGASVTYFGLIPGTSGRVEAWFGDGNTGSYATGAFDATKRRVWDGSTWGAVQTMLPLADLPRGPVSAVRHGTANLRAIATDRADTVTDTGAVRAKRYAYGDAGWVAGPTLNDPDLYQVALLLNFNGADGDTATIDASSWSHLHPVTFAGNAQLDTAQKKFGTASLLLDGTGDYISIPPSRDSQIPTGNEFKFDGFDSLELWIRPNELGRLQAIITTKENISGANYGFFMYQNTSNQIVLSFYAGAAGTGANLTSTTAMSTGTWYYITVQQVDGTDLELGINGTVEATANVIGSTGSLDEGGPLYIGHDPVVSGRNFNGWVDSIRWTKRTLRDVSTVPTTEFPVD